MRLRCISGIVSVALLVLAVLLVRGIREQCVLRIGRVMGTTRVRIGNWPAWGPFVFDPMAYNCPVPVKTLRRLVRERNGNWQGLAELEAGSFSIGQQVRDYRRAVAKDPSSGPILARAVMTIMAKPGFEPPEVAESYTVPPGVKLPPRKRPSPKDISECLKLIKAGIAAEPDNSFFDFSQAYVYAAIGRHEDMLASIEWGFRKPAYRAHFREALSSARELLRDAGVPYFESIACNVPYGWHAAQVKRLALTLRVLAKKAERRGDRQTGWRYRLAVFKIGDRMLRASDSEIDCIMGQTLQVIAMDFTSREEERARSRNLSASEQDAQKQRARLSALQAYVRNHRPVQGDWVLREYLAGLKFRRLLKEGFAAKKHVDYSLIRTRTDFLWYAGTILLVQILAVLALLLVLRFLPSVEPPRFGVAASIGVLGPLVVAGIALLAGWPWWLRFPPEDAFHRLYRPGLPPIPVIPASATWGITAIVPGLILLSGLIALVVVRRDRLRQALGLMRGTATAALPVLVLLYLACSIVTASLRTGLEHRAMRTLEPGRSPLLTDCLKKSGLL